MDDVAGFVRGKRGDGEAHVLEHLDVPAGADRELLAEILLRLSQFATRNPRIQEVDINPFLAATDRSKTKALDARVKIAKA